MNPLLLTCGDLEMCLRFENPRVFPYKKAYLDPNTCRWDVEWVLPCPVGGDGNGCQWHICILEGSMEVLSCILESSWCWRIHTTHRVWLPKVTHRVWLPRVFCRGERIRSQRQPQHTATRLPRRSEQRCNDSSSPSPPVTMGRQCQSAASPPGRAGLCFSPFENNPALFKNCLTRERDLIWLSCFALSIIFVFNSYSCLA